MLFRTVILLALGCQGDAPSQAPVARPAIEVVVAGKPVARVLPGHPCRATVDGVELIAGGPPLVATLGDVKWTADSASNGTTFKNNDRPVARIHANQLFDAQGIPLVKVTDDGSIVNGPGRVVRKATVTQGYTPQVEIRELQSTGADGVVVTHTEDVVLAALLSAPEADPTLRALVACHLLLNAGS